MSWLYRLYSVYYRVKYFLMDLLRSLFSRKETLPVEVDASDTIINSLVIRGLGIVQARNIRRISRVYEIDRNRFDFLVFDVVVRKSGRRRKLIREACVFFIPTDCYVFTLRTKWLTDCSLLLLDDELNRTFVERVGFWEGVGVEEKVKERLTLFIPGAFASGTPLA